MKAVILAAGVGSRLKPMTSDRPKCMVKVSGIPILGHQIDAYTKAGVNEIVIVAGYKAEQVCEYVRENYPGGPEIKIVENREYETTNNMYSLYMTADDVKGKEFLLSNGDVVFDPAIIEAMVHGEHADSIAVDKSLYLDESMKVTSDSDGLLNDISKKIPKEQAYAVSIDLYRFSAASSITLFNNIKRRIETLGKRNEWTEIAIQDLLQNKGLRMRPIDIAGKHWVEIDNYDDLASADLYFSKLRVADKELFFIDLDGTVYNDHLPVPGVSNFVQLLLTNRKRFYFLSNNSSRSKYEYVTKLKEMGIPAAEENIILSTDGLIDFLKEHKVTDVFVLGTRALRESVAKSGINIESSRPEYVVLGYDTELTYSKLREASLFIHKGAKLLATHCDNVCPTPEGPIPDIGSMIALLSTATKQKPYKVFGKPNKEMIEGVIRREHISPDEAVVIGDRLYTDFELAQNAGTKFILVLSGETKRNAVEHLEMPPDLIVRNLADLSFFFGSSTEIGKC